MGALNHARPDGEYKYVNPLSPGISVGISQGDNKGNISGRTGTLGAFLTGPDNQPYILTNSHIMDLDALIPTLTTTLEQPSYEDHEYAKEETRWYRFLKGRLTRDVGHVIASSKILRNVITSYNRQVGLDMVICRYVTKRRWSADPKILNYRYNSNYVTHNEEFKTDRVIKRGRSTNITTGRLQRAEMSVAPYNYQGDFLFTCNPGLQPRPRITTLFNQYVIRSETQYPFGIKGDSGSVCYLIENNEIRPLGLYHTLVNNTTIGIASSIYAVMDRLPGYQFGDAN
jgi:hypothetical protein